jgi:NAD-dependent dihydropyrimidine dehydrogenase PreA subunit
MSEQFPKRVVGEAFHALYETPAPIKPYIYMLLSAQEEALALFIGKQPKDAAAVAARFGISEAGGQSLLQYAYGRGNIQKDRDNPQTYVSSTLYDRLGVFTQYEQDAWQAIPREERAAIEEWYISEFTERQRKSMEEEGGEFYRDAVLPIEEAIAEAERQYDENSPYYVTPCNCRTTANNCHFSTDTCIARHYGPNSAWDRGHGRQVTLAELKELLRACAKEGLMQTVSPTGHICNCESCCCYEFRAALRLRSRGTYPKTPYIAAYEPEKCVGCGLCVKRCHFGAFALENRKAVFRPELCFGCGVCQITCPKKAIAVVERPVAASVAP